MRTDILTFIFGSEKRKKIVKTLLEYPNRQWSCSVMEDVTKLAHATVFRTLAALRYFGLLKSIRINRKDILYTLVSSSLTIEIERALNIERIAAKEIATEFVQKIKAKVEAVVLYGSTLEGDIKPESDIDILVIVKKYAREQEEAIQERAGALSSQANKTISVVVMDEKTLKKEKNGAFIHSIKAHHEVLYGKTPF